MSPIITRQPIIKRLRRFRRGTGAGIALTGGTAGGGAVIVGASRGLPQLRQYPSPGDARVPQFGQVTAFKVGSFIIETSSIMSKWHELAGLPPSFGLEMRFRGNPSIEKDKESQWKNSCGGVSIWLCALLLPSRLCVKCIFASVKCTQRRKTKLKARSKI